MWQDDIIIVTRGSAEEHYEEVAEVLSILEENVYRASIEIFPKECSLVRVCNQ